MRWSRVANCIFFMIIVSSFFGCSGVLPKEKVYPFSKAARVEVISYENRMEWDVEPDDDLIKDGTLRLDAKKIKERVTLNDNLGQRLYEFLFIEECPTMSSVSKCYDPRHMVIFYDQEGKVFSYFEICLECGGAEADFSYNEICNERTDKLNTIFKEAGIKYFGE